MNRFITLALVLITLTINAQDKEGCADIEPTYLNRMPGYSISECKYSEYNELDFFYYDEKGKEIIIKKAGVYREIWYGKKPEESRKFSDLQINKNYADAILKIKGNVFGVNKTFLTASIEGKEVYIQLSWSNSQDAGSYWMKIIEVAKMQQDIVVDMQEAIDRDGKAALYGILFDVGKSDIKPESAEALKQITDYLNGNPTVNIFIVGHTDNTGSFANNITLSKARAESIKTYLVTTGKISAARMAADGVASLCPVSTNTTDEGKKLNRRVEIVKQ